MSDSIIHLYKASAGAGKTYTLAKEFIQLLLEDPYSYKRILAVTFTNKATEEMQRRILKNLYSIKQGHQDKNTQNMVKAILAEWKPDDKERWDSLSEQGKLTIVKRNAGIALFLILHDYNHFQISTIDSFFQIVLRNLAKELGLGAYLNIIIDEAEPLDDAMKLLINDLKTNSGLKAWLNAFAEEKSDNNKSWKVDQEIASFGRNIFNDTFKENQESLSSVLKKRNALTQFRDDINKKLAIEKNAIKSAVDAIDKAFSASSYTVDDLPYKEKGAYAFVNQFKKAYKENNYSNCKDISECSRAQDALSDSTYWAKAKSSRGPGKALTKDQQALANYAEVHFAPLFRNLETVRSQSLPHILTCQLILEHIYKIGVINDLADKIREINATHNQFLLSDTPTLLNSMISEDDAPFIYEKIGTQLEHIMIDEFQDTSNTQWNNFKPLVKECLAQQKSNLIVGDAKQSIYRFRNGDWRIIEGLVSDHYFNNGKVAPINLGKNWRSEWEVVNFNNSIFSPRCKDDGTIIDPNEIAPIFSLLQDEYRGDSLFNKFCHVYQAAFQQCTKTDPKQGFVSMEFIPKPDDDSCDMNEVILEKLRLKVEELQDQGIDAKDITILIRKGKEIELIANYFSFYKKEHPESKYNYTIISNEAFKMESSKALEMIIDALRIIVDPDDPIAMMRLFLNYEKEVKGHPISEALSYADLLNNRFESAKAFSNLKEKVLSIGDLPLYELTENLSILLEINKMKNQESFLFSFFDGINEYITRKSPDISRFIDYWERVLKSKSIPFSDNIDGIKIMTIHKSKGLEFRTVIIPFCDWNLYGENQPMNPSILWCKTSGERFQNTVFQQLPIVPISYNEQMKKSLFAQEYQEEKIQRLADAINLLYVAFTRAERNLILFAPKPKDTDKINDCSALLYNLLEDKLVDDKYESGSLAYQEKNKNEKSEPNPFAPNVTSVPVPYKPFGQKAKFKQSNKASILIENLTLETDAMESKAIQRGLLLHDLFSRIRTEKDIDAAANQLLFEGLIPDEKEKNELAKLARKKIQEHKEWFKEGVQLYNECSILFRNEKGEITTRRPDRVIREGNKMIVIDFKTGGHYHDHQDQIDLYVRLLTEMGYEATGHLWYIDD